MSKATHLKLPVHRPFKPEHYRSCFFCSSESRLKVHLWDDDNPEYIRSASQRGQRPSAPYIEPRETQNTRDAIDANEAGISR